VRFGCNPRTPGLRGPLRMHKYLSELPPAPPSLSRMSIVPSDRWGMYDNDAIGDCTCAAVAHMLMLVTAFCGNLIVPDPSDVIKMYSAVSGYNPATGANDNGCDLPTVLNYWRDTGLAGHKILSFGDIDPQDMERQRQAMWIFGAVDQAAQVPSSMLPQFDANREWTIDPDATLANEGHSFPCFDYSDNGNACGVTWAREQWMNPGWMIDYLFESCAVVAPEWIDANPAGVAGSVMDTLIADLKAMGSWTNA
jgi:hypothetical protein